MPQEDRSFTAKDKFLPCLLDRLTDYEPYSKNEFVKPLSVKQLKQSIARDLSNLLNSKSKCAAAVLAPFQYVEDSVLNYGMDDFCGRFFDDQSLAVFEATIRGSIARFEPRIDPGTLHVKLGRVQEDSVCATFMVEVEGRIAVYPLNDEIAIKMRVDLDSGNFNT